VKGDTGLKIIQFGIGPIGSAIVKLLVRKKGFQIVGAIDIDKAKVGRDLGEVAGLQRNLGLKVSDNPTKVFREAKADLVVHSTSSFIPAVISQLEQNKSQTRHRVDLRRAIIPIQEISQGIESS